MRLFRRKTRLEQAVKSVADVRLPSALTDALPPKAVKSGVTAAAVVTAASAGISALRKRGGGDR
jgi:hypothetical protein